MDKRIYFDLKEEYQIALKIEAIRKGMTFKAFVSSVLEKYAIDHNLIKTVKPKETK